ncbi:hypothetical protein M011DRAFT_463800 [Sporormia fimetaria CBS 119925]|uniref:Uncharacterized protein n=1 Tax=Sporormia fimetaria CBS 119925 TaxID=1340428 RepID=A0A6A6VR12_9PLEO|nr:hypothetical protein M011DRAFT_463800 [Sporormia fimetaria CBS 119925]
MGTNVGYNWVSDTPPATDLLPFRVNLLFIGGSEASRKHSADCTASGPSVTRTRATTHPQLVLCHSLLWYYSRGLSNGPNSLECLYFAASLLSIRARCHSSVRPAESTTSVQLVSTTVHNTVETKTGAQEATHSVRLAPDVRRMHVELSTPENWCPARLGQGPKMRF